jgi:hypothetical protein
MATKEQTYEHLTELVSKCKFRDWNIVIDKDKKSGERPYVQIQFEEIDRFTGNSELQMCRKWYLSYHMTDSEVIRTVHKAIHTAMDHEVDEAFQYDGVRLFNPHHDLVFLTEFAKKRRIDIR